MTFDIQSIDEICRSVIQECCRLHTRLQTAEGGLSDQEAVMAMECLGNAALSAADFAHNALCAINEIDEGLSSRAIYNCRRMGVGVLLTAIDMRAAAARSPYDMQTLSSHAAALGAVCETHGIDPEDSRRFVQLLDVQHGQGNVRTLREAPTNES